VSGATRRRGRSRWTNWQQCWARSN
jgi:hypothetical protein